MNKDDLKELIKEEIKSVLSENEGIPSFEPQLVGKFQAEIGERSLVIRDKLGRGPHFVILDERKREVFEMNPENAKKLAELIGKGLADVEFDQIDQ